jgi:hypothetical protein
VGGPCVPSALHWTFQLHGPRAQSTVSKVLPVLPKGTWVPTAHLQTLGGALTEPSVVEGGGATGAGQKLLRESTNPGAVVAVLGNDGAARFAR